ncbi:MAG: hypothetical protein IT581_00635 [Verrucomicrobiales bacterium]|nr:hypothetical protein [Verrucomicrobiales bacterium]
MPESPEDASGSDFDEESQRLLQAMTNSWLMRNPEQLEAAAADLMKAAANHADVNPSPDALLEEDLEMRARAGEWEEILALREQLIERCRERGEAHHVFRHEREVATLLQHLGRPEEALLHAGRATAAARQTEGMPVLVGLARMVESVCAMQCKQLQLALKCVDDALVAIGMAEYAQLVRGGALVGRAHCLLSMDELAAAESDLRAAAVCLRIHAEAADLPGVQSRRAAWYEAQARLCGKKGEYSSAVEWMARVIEIRQNMVGHQFGGRFHALTALAGSYRQLAQACDDAGKPAEAASMRQRGVQLLKELKLPIPPD